MMANLSFLKEKYSINHLERLAFSTFFVLLFLGLVIPGPAHAQVNAQGWTVLDASKATKVVYVSSSEGNDGTGKAYSLPSDEIGNNPQLPAQEVNAFETILAAESEVRDGEAAWILLKTGDTFYEVLNVKSGRSATAPAVYSYYGEGTEPPMLKTGSRRAINKESGSTFRNSRHVYSWIVGLSFYAHTRNPDDPDYKGPKGGSGFWFYAGEGYTIEDILIEGCVFSYYNNNVIQGPGTNRNIRLRRNVFHNNYSPEGRSQGLYTSHVDGIFLEENIFDHNGYLIQARGSSGLDKTDGQATMHNHNTYFTSPENIVFRGNSFHRGSSIGSKWTAEEGEGSASNITIINNLYHDNEIGISIGGNASEPPYRFKNIRIIDNVLTQGGVSNTTNRNLAWYVDIEDWDGGVFANNLLIHQDLEARTNTYGLQITGETRDVQVTNNVFYNLKKVNFGVNVESAELDSVEISNNELVLDLGYDEPYVQLDQESTATSIFSGNTYAATGTIAPSFKIGYTLMDYESWISAVEEEGSTTEVPVYPAPERNLEMYVTEVLGLSGMDAYYEEIRKQSMLNWRKEYTAPVINTWIREGFNRTVTSVKERVSGDSELILYPNPGNNELTIRTLTPGKFKVKVMSLSGKSLLETTTTAGKPFDISSLKPGFYIIHIQGSKAGAGVNRRFLKNQL